MECVESPWNPRGMPKELHEMQGARWEVRGSRSAGPNGVAGALRALGRLASCACFSLQASQPFAVHVAAIFPDAGRLERYVHELLAYCRVTGGAGREWFECSLSAACGVIALALEARQSWGKARGRRRSHFSSVACLGAGGPKSHRHLHGRAWPRATTVEVAAKLIEDLRKAVSGIAFDHV